MHLRKFIEADRNGVHQYGQAIADSDKPLESAFRWDIQRPFVQDFSQVKVHPDVAVPQSTRDVLMRQYVVYANYGFDRKAHAMTGIPGANNLELPAFTPSKSKDPVPLAEGLPGSPSACVVHSAMPYGRSGIKRTLTGSVIEDFEVLVEWSSDRHRGKTSCCAAECGEYHQFVKGYMKSSPNRDGSSLTNVSGKVFGGELWDINVFREDGLDNNPRARYGHRNEMQTMNEKYDPDRATGNKYVGKDSPGVHIGAFADFDLTFIGKLVDMCNGTETVSDPWRINYKGVIRP